MLTGHTDKVWHAEFSPDGNRIVTSSVDGTARLWDSDGKQLAVLGGDVQGVRSAAFSPDGSRIVTTSEDGTARLFRVLATPHNSSTGAGATDAPARLRFEEVRSILEDSRGNYWFGSHNEGVCRFDGESYTYFTVEDGLSHNQIRTILEDRKGVIWFETGFGISSYDGERISAHTSRDYTSKDDWQLGAGDLWFKGDEGHGVNELEGRPGVYRYDGEKFTYLAFPLPEDRENDGVYSVTGAARGEGGKLWFATYGAVIGYDGESFTIIDNESLGLDEGDRLGIRCVFEDSKGNRVFKFNGESFDRIH